MPLPQPRPSARQRGYGSRWDTARATFLRANPFCRYCAQQGRRTPATVVDHIRPHMRDWALFWDSSNWQPLCAPCHNGAKRALELSGGLVRGCDVNGNPTDLAHPWNGGSKVHPNGTVKAAQMVG